MRYASSNDAHFVMNFNSMFNPNNQSGLNLVIGSDGLVYNIVPSVSSGAGLPDLRQHRQQPDLHAAPARLRHRQRRRSGGRISNPTIAPAKSASSAPTPSSSSPRRATQTSSGTPVIDPVWLANSPDADADAMRSAQANQSIPWRLLYRVTYSERFLPPVANEAVVVPQITPVMAVPVLNPASDFLFNNGNETGLGPQPGQRHREQHRARRSHLSQDSAPGPSRSLDPTSACPCLPTTSSPST